MERVRRFLVSRRSLVGFGLAGAGLVLHLAGLLTGPLWLTIVVGLYFVGALLVPGKRPLKVGLDIAADADSIRDGLDELVRQVQFKVAADILAKVESIRKAILTTLEDAPDRNTGDPTMYLIRQTALDYLPSALSAYLALPRIYAERRPTMGGRTPHDVLLEQLELMDAKMHEAADAKLAHDSERLLENGRFIADRFGVSSLRIDATPVPDAVPSATVPAAPTAEAETAEHERVH
jgi:hypothetical protein